MSSPLVSIVIPTSNRRDRLIRCITQIRRHVSIPRELIVVDGASEDGTQAWLAQQQDIHPIWEPRREGAVRAFNKGFRAARSPYVMWLNDDAYPLPGSVEAALHMLMEPSCPDLGLVAFYHNWRSPHNVLDRVEQDGATYSICHVRGYPYANFGLLRRDLLARIGFADERFHFFGFDPDLALTLQHHEGLRVLGCRRALIHHEELHDERKLHDLDQGKRDNEALFAKWRLPPPGGYPDPVPMYQSLIESLGLTVP